MIGQGDRKAGVVGLESRRLEMVSNERAMSPYKYGYFMPKRYLDKGLGDLAVLFIQIKIKECYLES